MRFIRLPRPAVRPINTRRIAAAERALQRERDKFPLLADWVAEQQPSAEERLDRFQTAEFSRQQGRRDVAAASWRRSRALLRLLPQETQGELLARWNKAACPGTSEYFSDAVFQAAKPLLDNGVITLPDPALDPRYRLQQMIEASEQKRLEVFLALQKRQMVVYS